MAEITNSDCIEVLGSEDTSARRQGKLGEHPNSNNQLRASDAELG